MIYLDNAATSYPKPRGMVAAMEECILKYCGNPGRSGHSMFMKTGEEVYHARRKIASLFGIKQPERLVFTQNTTEALNMGLKGVLQSGDHVITTTITRYHRVYRQGYWMPLNKGGKNLSFS